MQNRSLFNSTIDVSKLDGANGFRVVGIEQGELGFAASSAGDINGDGIDDLVINAPYYPWPAQRKGRSYVIFGNRNAWDSTLLVANLNGVNGFKIQGENIFLVGEIKEIDAYLMIQKITKEQNNLLTSQIDHDHLRDYPIQQLVLQVQRDQKSMK